MLFALLSLAFVLGVGKHPVRLLEEVDDKLENKQEGKRALESFGKDLFVVTVIGKYGTGKSFLINTLAGLKRNEMLGVGDPINTKARGIWTVGHPVNIDSDGELRTDRECKRGGHRCKRVVFNDAEYYNDMFSSKERDSKLTAFALRSSDLIILNEGNNLERSDIDFLDFCEREAARSCVGGKLIDIDGCGGATEENEKNPGGLGPSDTARNCDKLPHIVVTFQKTTKFIKEEEIGEHFGLGKRLEPFESEHCIQLHFPVSDSKRFEALKDIPFDELDGEYQQDIVRLRKLIYKTLDTTEPTEGLFLSYIFKDIIKVINSSVFVRYGMRMYRLWAKMTRWTKFAARAAGNKVADFARRFSDWFKEKANKSFCDRCDFSSEEQQP